MHHAKEHAHLFCRMLLVLQFLCLAAVVFSVMWAILKHSTRVESMLIGFLFFTCMLTLDIFRRTHFPWTR